MSKYQKILAILFCMFIIFAVAPTGGAYAQTEGPFGDPTCGDFIDNDGDGKKDSADTDCYNYIGDPAVDDDGDGWCEGPSCSDGSFPGDCNDDDTTIRTGATKICDGKDNNCDGKKDFTTDVDVDGDGVPWCANDCNDNNALMYPGNIEGPFGDATCSDTFDNDCDGPIDANDPGCGSPCLDEDGDGYYSINSNPACTEPLDDCNDIDPNINPGASDVICDGIDDNCSGTPDDGYVPDTSCGTGVCGFPNNTPSICNPDGTVTACQPGPAGVEGPAGDPTCSDTLDNDCDTLTDAADIIDCFVNLPDTDDDGDGYCEGPTCSDGSTPGDCNDFDDTIHPGAPDAICDGVDDNCSGTPDDEYVADTSCGVGVCAFPRTSWRPDLHRYFRQ
jgi:hypothetical protein